MAHSSKKIGSVQRALDILNLFNSQSSQLGTTEIANALGLHKSTAASLVYTLEANDYLQQNPDTRKFQLGLKLVERASAMLDQVQVRRVALPYLQELRDTWNETVNLAILDSGDVVYVERYLGTKALGMRSEVGRRESAHSTGLGKAMLACLPLADMRAFVQRYGLPCVTQFTITDPEKFFADLDKAREQGFAMDDQENELGGRCIAAPIFDHTGKVVAAVSVSAPLARLPMSDVPQVGEKVRETAKTISRGLGYLPRAY
jgi:IclR family transcriptional regulator, KDG regulon repressor